MKNLKNFTIFTENWHEFAILRDVNKKTGVFDEDGIEADLAEFEEAADKNFEKLFDEAFENAQLSGLFGGDFKEYMDARDRQNIPNRIAEKYKELVEAYKEFKNIVIDDLRNCD